MPNIKPVFITQAYLKEVATYDKENGEFRWNNARSVRPSAPGSANGSTWLGQT